MRGRKEYDKTSLEEQGGASQSCEETCTFFLSLSLFFALSKGVVGLSQGILSQLVAPDIVSVAWPACVACSVFALGDRRLVNCLCLDGWDGCDGAKMNVWVGDLGRDKL